MRKQKAPIQIDAFVIYNVFKKNALVNLTNT